MTEVAFPTFSNDSGDLQSGTIINEDWLQDVEDAINAIVHSSTNPTVTPEDIIDEVVTARGSIGTLDGRLDVEHNNDGTHNLPATFATRTILQNVLGGTNMVADSTMVVWAAGDSAAPSYYTLSGTGAAVARAGDGLADTNRKVGPYCAKVTYGSAVAYLSQTLVGTTEWGVLDNLEGFEVSLGCWVKGSAAGVAFIRVDDGSGSPSDSDDNTSTAWEWLSVNHTIASTATELTVRMAVESGSAHFSGLTAILINDTVHLVPGWLPSEAEAFTIVWSFDGTPAIGDHQREFSCQVPFIIKDVQCISKTAGSGAFTIDIEAGNGTSWNSIFSGAKTIVTSAKYGSVQPDGTYRYRCLKNSDNTTVTDALLRLNLDAINAIVNPVILVRCVKFLRPFQDNLDYNQVG